MNTLLASKLSLQEQMERIIEARVHHQLNLQLAPLRVEAENAKRVKAQLQQDLNKLKEQATANTTATTTGMNRMQQNGKIQGEIVKGIEEQKQMLMDMHMTMQKQLQEQQHTRRIDTLETQDKDTSTQTNNDSTQPQFLTHEDRAKQQQQHNKLDTINYGPTTPPISPSSVSDLSSRLSPTHPEEQHCKNKQTVRKSQRKRIISMYPN